MSLSIILIACGVLFVGAIVGALVVIGISNYGGGVSDARRDWIEGTEPREK